jgi:PilZ domain
MLEAERRLSPQWGVGGGPSGARQALGRREPREETVRLAEFAPFPRVRRDQRWQGGLTRDLSATGACIQTEEAPPVGSLLRVIVRSVDGRPTAESIARVVWCQALGPGRVRLGLETVARRRVAKIPEAA